MRSDKSRRRFVFLCVAPATILFFLFMILPTLNVFRMSLYERGAYSPNETFVGLKNFQHLLKDTQFIRSMQNMILLVVVVTIVTFAFALVTGPASYVLCFFFAWIINDMTPRVRSLLTLVFYAPSISGNLFSIWLLFFSGDMYGYLNSYLMKIGLLQEPVVWLRDPRYMFAIVVIVQLWASLGTSFLSMRAGFTTIDKQYYEAAAVDGIRDRWQELWHITLPMMAPHLMLSAVLSITAAFSVANVAIALTGMPSTNYATHTLLTHMIDYGTIRYERGYASAIATLLFLISIGLNKLIQSRLKRLEA